MEARAARRLSSRIRLSRSSSCARLGIGARARSLVPSLLALGLELEPRVIQPRQ